MNLKTESAGMSTRTSGSQNLQQQDQWFPEMDATVHVLEADGGIQMSWELEAAHTVDL